MLLRANFIQLIVFLLIINVSFVSCKKDEDKDPPVVTIKSPLQNAKVDGGFGFLVTGTIVDNENIKDMQIKLESESNNINSSYFRRIEVNKSSHDFSVEVLIENDDFVEGYYSLSVIAFDGTNNALSSVRVYVNFEPIKFLGCVSATSSSNGTTINLLNPNTGVNTLFGSAAVSFGGLAVNNKQQLFIIAEKDQHSITGRKKTENTPVWSVTNTNSTGSYQYKSLTTYDNLIYALTYDNNIEVYNRDGGPQNTIPTFYRPILITKTSNRIFTVEQTATNRYYLGIYNRLGGQLSSILLDFIPVGIEGQRSGDLYVIGNKNGAGLLKEYKTVAAAFNHLKDLNYEVRSSSYCDGRLFFNSTTGNLYEFSINFNNGVQRASGVFADLMKCHEATTKIYYNHNTQGTLGLFDVTNNSKVFQRSYSSKVLGIEFLYSR